MKGKMESNVWTSYNEMQKDKDKNVGGGRRVARVVAMVLAAAMVSGLVAYLYLTHPDSQDYQVRDFDKRLKEVCASPRLAMPEYRGVQSFFHYLTHSEADYCYSWVEFGGEKIPIPSQTEKNCADEVRKSKYICFNEEYEMTSDPCLVYSFDADADKQFERDMNMFSCEVHLFDPKVEHEHMKRTDFWYEHGWTIGEFPYDKPLEADKVERRRSLDVATKILGHVGRDIKYVKSDLEGREWILLRQIITNSDVLDVHQIGMRLHIPVSVNHMSGEARHEYFAKLFQVFQGLSCAGYKYVLGRPIKYYKGVIKVPEAGNTTYYPAYEVNWVKVKK